MISLRYPRIGALPSLLYRAFVHFAYRAASFDHTAHVRAGSFFLLRLRITHFRHFRMQNRAGMRWRLASGNARICARTRRDLVHIFPLEACCVSVVLPQIPPASHFSTISTLFTFWLIRFQFATPFAGSFRAFCLDHCGRSHLSPLRTIPFFHLGSIRCHFLSSLSCISHKTILYLLHFANLMELVVAFFLRFLCVVTRCILTCISNTVSCTHADTVFAPLNLCFLRYGAFCFWHRPRIRPQLLGDT